jgi:cobalt-zinc-cadmium resistance protein CzcA
MLDAIVLLCTRRRGVVVVVWLAILAMAAIAVPKLGIDAIPDVTPVQVSIITSSPALSAEEVEQYLTIPVEMAMSGVPGVVKVRSVSRAAVSLVTLIFKDGTGTWFARQLVSERLREAEESIPKGYGVPTLAPVSTALGEIYEFSLTSDTRSPTDLRATLDWDIAPALRTVPGVIEVNAMGGFVKQYQVIVNPRRLAAYQLPLHKLLDALRSNNINVGSGYVEKDMEGVTIRGEGQLQSVDDIANVAITANKDGTPILVKHVARVVEGEALRFGTVTKVNEGEVVAGTVMMLIGSNSRQVVAQVKQKLEEIQGRLPADVKITSYYDRAEFIGRTLATVFHNLAESAALVVVILLITLGSLRAALLASLAIPFSMALTILAMVATDVTGNLMSLGAIDFGLLVDGAIVMLEVALVELGHHTPGAPKSVARRIGNAMSPTARTVTFSLLIILLVYLPLMALEGTEGKMFAPMAITIAYALASALLFSLTAVPAMSAFVLRPEHHEEPRWLKFLRETYRRGLDASLASPRRAALGCLVLVLMAGAMASGLGAEFVPRLEEGELSLDVKRLPSVSLRTAQALGVQVEQALMTIPEVTSVVTRTGRAEVATDPVGPDETEVMVKLKPREAWTSAHDLDGLGDLVKRTIETRVPATFVAVSQPIEDTVNQLVAGARADVAIKLFGKDLKVLKKTADGIAKIVAEVPGAGDWRVQRVLGLPLLTIKPERARLARYGIDAADVLDIVQASRLGQDVGWIFEGSRRFALTVLMPPSVLSPKGFGDLLVASPSGTLLPLAAVSSIQETEGPAVIHREDFERRVMVEVNVRGRDLLSYVNDAKARLASFQLPEGVRIVWGGQFENFDRAQKRLSALVPVAIGLIFCMLFLMFGDVRCAASVFAAVPFAAIGGLFLLWARGLPFSIPAAVGFIAVGGVAVLNGVVMAGHYVRLRTDRPLPEAVREAANASLRPMLTTALVAAVGFLPMALSTQAGAEVQRPLATVVIGGILSSTLLVLLVLPLLLVRAKPPEVRADDE